MRQIFVSVDITAPLYFFKELDTYKVGTVSNSTSTMHKIATTPITFDCFETDDYHGAELTYDDLSLDWDVKDFIQRLEWLRKKYLETKDKRYWKEHCKHGLGIDTPVGNKLYKAIEKDGLQNFSFEVLEECPKEQLNEKEKYYIELYDTYNFGYNSTKGNK